jgi:hypothetical protein
LTDFLNRDNVDKVHISNREVRQGYQVISTIAPPIVRE